MSEVEAVTKKEPAPAALLCKGAMPMPMVWFIKFHESHENKSDVARAYFTTVGKITDIQKGNNQKYIVESMTWSDEELDKAEESIKANFVRGQDNVEEATKRQLATTSIGDATYSLRIIEEIRGMELEGVSLTEARAEYLADNPRKVRAKKTDGEAAEAVEEGQEAVEEGQEAVEEGLLEEDQEAVEEDLLEEDLLDL